MQQIVLERKSGSGIMENWNSGVIEEEMEAAEYRMSEEM